MDSLLDPDFSQQEQADEARMRADAEAWVAEFQKPVRRCYAELGINFEALPPLTPEEHDSLMEGAYDEKYAEWLDLA